MRDECTNDSDWEIRREMKRIKERLEVTKNASERLYLEDRLRKIREIKHELKKMKKWWRGKIAKRSRSHNGAGRTGGE